MTTAYSRDDVQTHYGCDRPAVNVKVYSTLADGWRDFARYESDAHPSFTAEWLSEHVSESAIDARFWDTCAHEWEMVEQDAEEIFGKGVMLEQDGRMGGWAVVTSLPDIDEWDAIALAKWRRFERLAKGIAGDIMYQMLASFYLNEFEQWREDDLEDAGSEIFAPELAFGAA